MKSLLEGLVREGVQELFGVSDIAFSVEHPELSHGDYTTNAALIVAKKVGKNPHDIATALASYLEEKKGDEIASITIAGPGFINFLLSKTFFSRNISTTLSSKKIQTSVPFKNTTWVVEYASPNPNKAMHLGHLRNVVTGIAVANILEANGATVIRDMIDNNRGIAIAKLMWGYLVGARKDGKRIEDISYWNEHQDEWLTPEEVGKSSDQFIDEWYVYGAAECENKEVEEKVRNLVVEWEKKNPLVWKLWEKVLSYSYEGQKKTLERLGARFDKVWHEHEHYEEGKIYIEEGLAKGIFTRLPDGAILTNLAHYNLPDTILIKRDGTSLYITQDIALTALKKKTHHADKLLWVIGPEQSLAMKQLFGVCEQLGIGMRDEFVHITYGYMSIKGEGKMSSRKGNVLYIDSILDRAKEGVLGIIKDRISGEIQDIVAEKVAHAAVTFGILKAGRVTDIAFDIELALQFEGDTGPYLQYSAARAASVLEKAKEALQVIENKSSDIWQTTTLERLLYRFPEVVERAGEELAPNFIAEYLIALAAAFNSFYGSHQIIAENDLDVPYKLALTKAFHTTLVSGLSLLGISVPEKM